MRLIRQLSMAAALVGTSLSAQAVDFSKVPAGEYKVDPTHAYVHFQYTHLGLSRPLLSFDEFSVDVNLDIAPHGRRFFRCRCAPGNQLHV